MTSRDLPKYFVPNEAIYLTTVGYGTGALLGRGIKRSLASIGSRSWASRRRSGCSTSRTSARSSSKAILPATAVRARERQDRAGLDELYAGTRPGDAAPLRRDRRQDRRADLSAPWRIPNRDARARAVRPRRLLFARTASCAAALHPSATGAGADCRQAARIEAPSTQPCLLGRKKKKYAAETTNVLLLRPRRSRM